MKKADGGDRDSPERRTFFKEQKMTVTSPYEFYQNTPCVRSSWLYKEAKLISESLYKKLRRDGWAVPVKLGGNGREALIEFEPLRSDIKQKIVEVAGDPYKVATKSLLQDLIQPDATAANFFLEYRKPNGEPLAKPNIEKYTINACIYNAISIMLANEMIKTRSFGTRKKTKIWEKIAEAVNTLERFNHSIPGNPRSLQRAYEKYQEESYGALIHKNEGNENSAKLKGEPADWILAQYCLPNKPMVPSIMAKYNTIKEAKGWPDITESAVNLWLEKTEVKRIWMLSRHGKDAWTKEFGHHIKREKSNWFPNVYWAIDGTKFDSIHYEDNVTGLAAKMKINVVIDVFSEKIIGWSYSQTEDHTDHFKALKMAFNNSGCRPYLFTYDQQSGHKSKRMQDLYTSIVAKQGGNHYKHKAYKHSNPIEQIFNRLQKQEISMLWFSDKQSPTVRDLNNKPNMEFILANKERLLTKEELQKAWELCVTRWNESKHPKFDKSRSEVYEMPMPMREDVDFLDMVSMFWIEETKPITYKRGGLLMKIKGVEHEFEVYNPDGSIDLDFRLKHVGEKFIVRYDPEYLDECVQLYQESVTGLIYVADAKPKRGHENIPVLMQEGDKVLWHQDSKVSDLEYERDQKAYKELMARTGITPESLIDEQELLIKTGGKLPKSQRNEVESNTVFTRL